MKVTSAVVALLLSSVVLGGCGGESKVDDTPKTGSNASTAEEPTDEPVDEETTPEPAENPSFGESVTYEDGLQITVKKPKSAQISEYSAMTKEWPAYLAFEIVVVNNTGKNFDVSAMYFSMQSSDKEAEEIFDSENGFEGTPTTKLLDGRQSKFKVGFGVSDPKDLVLEVETGDFDRESTLFVS